MYLLNKNVRKRGLANVYDQFGWNSIDHSYLVNVMIKRKTDLKDKSRSNGRFCCCCLSVNVIH